VNLEAAYALAINRGALAVPCETIEQLDNRSLETGCRPYLCPDMSISLLESARKREEDDGP
jgi:hypothetical protein